MIGDHTVYYLEGGGGETILLVHGFGESTKRQDASYTIVAQIERLDKIAEALSLNSFHVAGNSMGGNISGKYAARFP